MGSRWQLWGGSSTIYSRHGSAAIDYTTEVQSRVNHQLPASTRVLALGCFAAFTLAGYVLYVGKNERG